jgi:NAD(P)-dependent dehydrogenase (short-subunit alcohol dehydrogenase family)
MFLQAAAFPISDYNYKEVQSAFRAVRAHWPNTDIRVALFNAGFGVWKPFLQITEEEVDRATDTNVKAAFAFSREAITAFQGQSLDERGKRGTLLFTGATASLRGNTTTSAFSAAKFALRSLSQSLNKEFGKENIHVRTLVATIDSTLIVNFAFLPGGPRMYTSFVPMPNVFILFLHTLYRRLSMEVSIIQPMPREFPKIDLRLRHPHGLGQIPPR